MNGERITLATADGIAHLELSRPEARNAMDLAYFAGRPDSHAEDVGWMVDHWQGCSPDW